jgi:hypothetical protein
MSVLRTRSAHTRAREAGEEAGHVSGTTRPGDHYAPRRRPVAARIGDPLSETAFLETAIHGRHPAFSEDRLTQIFVASFNSSVRVRQALGVLLSIPEARKLKATSQVHDGAGRIDVVLHRETREVCRIENKIEAPLTLRQMHRYAQNGNGKSTRVVALVKRYPAEAAVLRQFDIFRWSSLDRLLARKEFDPSSADGFVSLNFHRHLEELGMAKVDRIPITRLRDLSKAIHSLRTEKFPGHSLSRTNFFETATDVLSICQDLIDEARKDVALRKRIGSAFRFNPRIHSIWTKDDEGKKLEELALTAGITLKKPVNGVKEIEAGIAIDVNDPSRIAIGTWFLRPDNYYETEIFAKAATLRVKRELHADDFVRFCLKRWRKTLLRRK